MAKLVWTARARADLRRLRDFLVDQNPEAAARAVRTIREGLNTLKIAPGAGKIVDRLPADCREWPIPFGKSAYMVLYRIDGETVVIQALRHGREAGYSR
jgi:plasmid stabilization system protein ParE